MRRIVFEKFQLVLQPLIIDKKSIIYPTKQKIAILGFLSMLLLFSLNIPELLTESVDSVKNLTSRHHRVTSHHIVETVLLLCASPRVHFQEALFLVASAELGPLKRKIFFR